MITHQRNVVKAYLANRVGPALLFVHQDVPKLIPKSRLQQVSKIYSRREQKIYRELSANIYTLLIVFFSFLVLGLIYDLKPDFQMDLFPNLIPELLL